MSFGPDVARDELHGAADMGSQRRKRLLSAAFEFGGLLEKLLDWQVGGSRGQPARACAFSSVCAGAQRTKGQESTYTGIRSAGEINDP